MIAQLWSSPLDSGNYCAELSSTRPVGQSGEAAAHLDAQPRVAGAVCGRGLPVGTDLQSCVQTTLSQYVEGPPELHVAIVHARADGSFFAIAW